MIKISLFNASQVRSVVVSAWNGAVNVSAAGILRYVIAQGESIFVGLRDDALLLMDEYRQIGAFERVAFEGADSSVVVRIRPVSPQLEARNYEDTITMSVDVNKIQMINIIDEDKYNAGVIEAEAGVGHTSEFYKAKAIICRTYLYANIDRHQHEGFNLCDGVHCQVYKGQCRNNTVILPAVVATKNIIIVDPQNSNPILATYHSNCGGITESAENVWHSSLPYLVPVVDPYCISSPNARWQRTIPLEEWKAYLIGKSFSTNPNLVADFSFQQMSRKLDYKTGNISIPFRQMRNDWSFKSTFFSVRVEDGNVVVSGRGFGHGVGLCQEGAMEMGRRGYKYDEIIHFYYKDVRIVTRSIPEC